MKNLNYCLSLLFLIPFSLSKGQTFTTTVTLKDKPTEKVSHLSGEELESDTYAVDIYLSASQEVIDKVGKYNIDQKVYINDKEAKVDLWISYSSSDALGSPSVKANFDLSELIIENSHLAIEKGNKLKVVFINKNQDNATLASSEMTFDVPGFNNSASKFCNELYTFKAKDEKVIKTLHTIFKAVYPHTEIVETLMDDEWNISPTMGGNNNYMVVFKHKGVLWVLRYSASYVIEDGKILEMPRVKIYNGLDDPMPLSESCFTALKSVLK